VTGSGSKKRDEHLAPLGILAGGGPFPRLLAEAMVLRGRSVFIFAIDGEATPDIAHLPHIWIKRGQLGALLSGLRQRGIRDLALIGWIRARRLPYLNEIDLGGIWSVIRHLRLLSSGDDGVLRRLARLFEAHGLRIVGAADMAPELTIPFGVATKVAPEAALWRDIRIGVAAARQHGARDLGQAVIIRDGVVVATETRAGTDAMLQEYAMRFHGAASGGILIKCLKPNQDPRLDMPAIGPETAAGAIAAGLAGIAVSASTTLVVDLPEIVARLDAAGRFLVAVALEDEPA
jgi:DUF1009 family protein